MAALPFELLENILRRLPVKTLKRFRAVAKSWCYLIDSDRFVKSHLHESLISNSHRNLITGAFRAYSIDLDSLDKAEEIKAPFDYNNRYRISNSCNGIVLVVKEPPVLWNPYSRDYGVLPELPIDYPAGFGYHSKVKYGFGYDSRNDDYKVVCVVEFSNEITSDWMHSKAWIYGLKSNSWRRIEDFAYQLHHFNRLFSLHINGALHTQIKEDDRMRIMAFSVESEEHYEVMVAPGIEMSDHHLGVFDGCLSLVCFCLTRFVIWIMKEYGVAESWTELFSLSISPPKIMPIDLVDPLVYCGGGDKILMNSSHLRLFWYDLRQGTVENVAVNGMPYSFYADVCVETLVSFKGMLSPKLSGCHRAIEINGKN